MNHCKPTALAAVIWFRGTGARGWEVGARRGAEGGRVEEAGGRRVFRGKKERQAVG